MLLAEDVSILREALTELLSREDGIEVVAAVASGAQIAPSAVEHRPDVAVIDIDLPDLDGVSAAAVLRARLPGCRVLFLTALSAPALIRRALEVDLAGLVDKDIRPADLAAAVRAVAAGQMVIDPELALTAVRARPSPLSERETQVLRLSATGAGPLEIAERLFLSYGTVRNYLTSAAGKVGGRNRVDAIRIASEAGWI